MNQATPDQIVDAALTQADSFIDYVKRIKASEKVVLSSYTKLCDLLRKNNKITEKEYSNIHTANTLNFDSQMALEGLKELGGVVMNSGLPEAFILFTTTYMLVDGINKATEEAKEYRI